MTEVKKKEAGSGLGVLLLIGLLAMGGGGLSGGGGGGSDSGCKGSVFRPRNTPPAVNMHGSARVNCHGSTPEIFEMTVTLKHKRTAVDTATSGTPTTLVVQAPKASGGWRTHLHAEGSLNGKPFTIDQYSETRVEKG